MDDPGQGLPRLFAVTPEPARRAVASMVAAYRGGLRLLQLRDRSASDQALGELVDYLRSATPEMQLLLNGRPALARRLGVGLHLPESLDLPAAELRPTRWGRSVHSLLSAQRAAEEGAHYLVLGTVAPTPSKPGHDGMGFKAAGAICRAVPVPVFLIGGMSVETAGSARLAGAHGIAVQRAVFAVPDPDRACRRIIRKLSRGSRGVLTTNRRDHGEITPTTGSRRL